MGLKKLRGLLSMIFIFVCLVGAAFMASFCQAMSYVLVRPFSLPKHRQICLLFSYAFLLCSVFLLENWSGMTFKLHGDRISPTSAHLCVINHHSNIDWLLGLAFVAKMRFPYPGNAKSVVKASLGQVPLFGYLLRFAEFLFLTRSWEADRDKFLGSLVSLKGYSQTCAPLWFTLYPEGTRLTQEKLERSQAYAASQQREPLHHVLFPRFKAFTAIVPSLRDEFDGVVDATCMFEGDLPSVNTALAGTANTIVHTHVKVYAMKDLPEGEEQLENWLLDRWYEKDRRIADFKRDPATLGPADSEYFPAPGMPSLRPLYALVGSYFLAAVSTMYLASKTPNGLSILMSFSCAAVVLTAVVTALNLRPSRKGGKKKSVSRPRPLAAPTPRS